MLAIQLQYPISTPNNYDCVCQSPFDENDFSWAEFTNAECIVSNIQRK